MRKIVILGSGGVGKSCVTLRFISNRFSEDYDATIEDFYRKTIDVDGKTEELEILDTAGQEEFNSMLDGWIRPSEGIILIYDITSRHTFEELYHFYERILECKDTEKTPIVIVGNKCDMESARKVSTLEGQSLSAKWNCPFLEISAKMKIKETECFREIVREIRRLNSEIVKNDKKERFCNFL